MICTSEQLDNFSQLGSVMLPYQVIVVILEFPNIKLGFDKPPMRIFPKCTEYGTR